MAATSFTAESSTAPVRMADGQALNVDDIGGLSMLQISIVVSLEMVRLLITSADTELAEGARACGLRAWDLFRQTGHLLASYSQTAKRVGRTLPELLASAEQQAAPASFGHIRGLVRDMDREAEGVQQAYVSLGHDAQDLLWRAAAAGGSLEDLLQLRKTMSEEGASKVLAFLLAPVQDNHNAADASNAAADPSAAAAESSQLSVAELCTILAQRAALAAGTGEEAQVSVISALRRVDDSVIGCQAFWEDMRSAIRRLALMGEHLDILAPGAARNEKLRERYEARLHDYSEVWASLLLRTASSERGAPPISPRSAAAGM